MPGVGRNKRSALRRLAALLTVPPPCGRANIPATGADEFSAVGDFGEP